MQTSTDNRCPCFVLYLSYQMGENWNSLILSLPKTFYSNRYERGRITISLKNQRLTRGKGSVDQVRRTYRTITQVRKTWDFICSCLLHACLTTGFIRAKSSFASAEVRFTYLLIILSIHTYIHILVAFCPLSKGWLIPTDKEL